MVDTFRMVGEQKLPYYRKKKKTKLFCDLDRYAAHVKLNRNHHKLSYVLLNQATPINTQTSMLVLVKVEKTSYVLHASKLLEAGRALSRPYM